MKATVLTCAAALVLGSAVVETANADFIPGDVFAGNYSGVIRNITPGGNAALITPLVTVATKDIGKAAFSADLSTMYISDTGTNSVIAVDSAGNSTVFATGLSTPMGITRVADGRLLVTEYTGGEVTDITAGGDFTGAAPFASNLALPGDITQTPDGRIFATQTFSGIVSNITAGGVITAGDTFASGLGQSYSLIPTPSSGLLVAGASSSAIYAVTSAGAVTTFATGRPVWGITYSGTGQLLEADYPGNSVYDVSAGGNMLVAPVFAINYSDVNSLWTVPVPEPTLGLLLLAPALLSFRRARRPAHQVS